MRGRGKGSFGQEVIRRMIRDLTSSLKDIERTHINSILDIMDGKTGRMLDLPSHIKAQREYGFLCLYQEKNIEDGENTKTIRCEIHLEGVFTP